MTEAFVFAKVRRSEFIVRFLVQVCLALYSNQRIHVPGPPGMNYLRRTAVALCRLGALVAWCGLGLWTALAVFFKAPLASWLSTALALAIGLLYVAACREGVRLWQLPRAPWPAKRLTVLALAITAAVAVGYFGLVRPDANQEWSPEQARMPIVKIAGDRVSVSNVRNFTWHTATDFTPGFYDRAYDVSKLDSMYYVVVPMPAFDGVAHVFVSFGFSDVLGLRGAIWKKPVYFYPARTTNERKRAIFLDMMRRAHELEEHPEFYNLLTNNCMNNITAHLRRLGGRPLPHDLSVLLTGMSDRVAYDFGYLDTDLPFAAARPAFRIDAWMRHTPLDADFSRRLRAQIAKQVAEAQVNSSER